MQTNNRRVRYAAAPADLYADAGSAFVYPKAQAADVDTGIKKYARKFLAGDHDHYAQVVGERTASIKLVTELIGAGAAGSATAAVDGENGLLFKSVYGNQQKDTGSLTTAGTTATVVKVASTTNLSVGNCIGLVDPATGLYHARQIRSKTATDLTLDRLLPFTPAVGATVYASNTFWKAYEGHQHLWFDVEGVEATAAENFRRYVRGALGNFALKAGPLSTLEWDFMGLDWDDSAQGTAQPAPSYPPNMPQAGTGTNRLTRLSVGATELSISDFSYDLGNEVKAQLASGKKNGIEKFRVTDSKHTMSFKTPWAPAAAARITDEKSGTLLDVLVEITFGGPGNAFAIVAPKVQIVSTKLVSQDGIDYLECSCDITRPDAGTVPAAVLSML